MIVYVANCVIIKKTSSEPLCIIFTKEKDEGNYCVYNVISIIRNNMKKYISNQFRSAIVRFVKNRAPYISRHKEKMGPNPETYLLNYLNYLSFEIKLITLPTFRINFILSMEITNYDIH